MAKGTWRKLVTDDLVGRVTLLFEKVVEGSLTSHPVAKLTQAEVKGRFDKCAKIFEQLRGDLKWGIARIEERLPGYFSAEMNGTAWTPDKRTWWLPEDGPAPMVRDGEPIEAEPEGGQIIMPGDPGFIS
jgi:hypothetical protein